MPRAGTRSSSKGRKGKNMLETNPAFGQAWIEPHLFWLSIGFLIFAIMFRRWATKLEREEYEEMKKHEEFKKAMDKE